MYLTHLDCPRCGKEHAADRLQNLCECGSPLLARYDLPAVAKAVTPERFPLRPADLWRYREVLPVADPRHVTTLGEGWTPLLRTPAYGTEIGITDLMVKDEGLIPTGSFKARGAAVGVSRARELGVERIAMPTNGNAGSAWATYAARAGMGATIVMPLEAPSICRRECVAAGADLRLIDGLIGDAGRRVAELIAESNGAIFDAGTLREPYRLEGKKTMGYEIVEQLGWQTPDVIIYPTGGGVGLIGIHKALHELRELGWIGDKLPRLVAVQSTGCAPIVRAFAAGEDRAQPWADAHTVAFGITVPAPLGDELILAALRESSGTAVAVDDADILADLRDFAAREGLLLCPEGAACLTAARQLRAGGWIRAGERVVVLNTGAGLKYPDTVDVSGVPVMG
ncbi:threonine synthase [Micromonospora saelicesensis]|uniref:Threonine synthase n=1 Tax=Micromonospora saelicesensis TaxID=285676 RepID=A0A1C4U0K9_9ACTN|nr:threonine synthase [Micromonospora saelicesensis]RAN99845.1 Threonine synthase [Micromonospora saelicesensis]RAO41991.1 Threonine synthase [Micromonospora saelicesensis]RAO45713.1 Threonine synthase [Micromonospora saelicesensis]RAO59800.1 Threonine synthase [Micromonospora saelicesensis]SCE65225.1 threonine synthase [Micromonospora saelicesensis]